MSDEQKKDEPQAEPWEMPEPIFRSTPGKTPNKPDLSQEEIATEPGFSEMETEENVEVPNVGDDTDGTQSVRPSTKVRVRTKKKGGCARFVLTVIGLIAFLAIAILGAMIYLLFYYRPTDTATF